MPQKQKPRPDKPSRAKEFSAKDLPPSLRGLMVDESSGVIKSISSGEKFRSNDYGGISAHWYNGQKKAYVSSHHCRSNGEMIRKRTDMPPFFPGDSIIQLPAILQSNPATTRPPVQDVILQRGCRSSALSLEAVFDPLHLGWDGPAQQAASETPPLSTPEISTITRESEMERSFRRAES